jgi:hypothetical protein
MSRPGHGATILSATKEGIVMDYEKSVDFAGNVRQALSLAEMAFVQAGYRILDSTDTRVSARYDGGFVGMRYCSPMCSASPITISVAGRRLIVTARYEGIAKVRKFLVRFLVGLALLLALTLGGTFSYFYPGTQKVLLGVGLGLGIPLIQLPIHVLLTPAIMKQRAIQALDTLVHNMTMLSTRK